MKALAQNPVARFAGSIAIWVAFVAVLLISTVAGLALTSLAIESISGVSNSPFGAIGGVATLFGTVALLAKVMDKLK